MSWKATTGKPRMTYDASVEEALAFGWIDSKPGKLDAERPAVVLPAQPDSGWSRPNKERVARLERAGRMAPAGMRVVEAARKDGSWSRLDEVEEGTVPPDLTRALAGDRGRDSSGTGSRAPRRGASSSGSCRRNGPRLGSAESRRLLTPHNAGSGQTSGRGAPAEGRVPDLARCWRSTILPSDGERSQLHARSAGVPVDLDAGGRSSSGFGAASATEYPGHAILTSST